MPFAKGIKWTEEQLRRQRLKVIGREVCWDEREKKSRTLKGKPRSPETIAKMKAHKRTEEHKRKISEANKGVPKSLKHRQNISKANKGNPKLTKPRGKYKIKNREQIIKKEAEKGNSLKWLEPYLD